MDILRFHGPNTKNYARVGADTLRTAGDQRVACVAHNEARWIFWFEGTISDDTYVREALNTIMEAVSSSTSLPFPAKLGMK